MDSLYDAAQLPEIREIRATWSGPGIEATGLWSYHNFKGSMQLAYGFAFLFWPDFVEVDGALILAEKYTDKSFQTWYAHFEGDLTAIEKTINHVHLEDLFLNAAANEELESPVWEAVLLALKSCWEAAVAARFPGQSVVVETWDPEDGSTPQLLLYQQR